jgi:hypothetical protein
MKRLLLACAALATQGGVFVIKTLTLRFWGAVFIMRLTRLAADTISKILAFASFLRVRAVDQYYYSTIAGVYD